MPIGTIKGIFLSLIASNNKSFFISVGAPTKPSSFFSGLTLIILFCLGVIDKAFD